MQRAHACPSARQLSIGRGEDVQVWQIRGVGLPQVGWLQGQSVVCWESHTKILCFSMLCEGFFHAECMNMSSGARLDVVLVFVKSMDGPVQNGNVDRESPG